ncbi:MAG: hypothetical protein ABSF98_17710 [Bryobacteraceae bacterium]|jgi:hypothetical protein
MRQLMAPWSDDFSECSLEEVLRSQAENRAWGKELRRRTNALVNDRLAKSISQDDYVSGRRLVHEDGAEYRRRAAILDSLIIRRSAYSQPRES